MRSITHIVCHCTATPQTATVNSIKAYWRDKLKWVMPGYHHIITPNGDVVNLLPIELVSNGVKGWNAHSIHISYIGGVDDKGNALDNRTEAQISSLIALLKKYNAMFPKAKICGHRDFPGVKKECPSLDIAAWLEKIKFFGK